MVEQLFDMLSQATQRSLDVRMRRHVILSANLANADTPGYIPIDMEFEDALRAVADGKVGVAVPGTPVFYDPTATPGPDGNAVNLDHEMAKLSMNEMKYTASTKIMDKRLGLLRYAIMEGRS